MADKPISDPLCRNIGNISSPSRFFFPTVKRNPALTGWKTNPDLTLKIRIKSKDFLMV